MPGPGQHHRGALDHPAGHPARAAVQGLPRVRRGHAALAADAVRAVREGGGGDAGPRGRAAGDERREQERVDHGGAAGREDACE